MIKVAIDTSGISEKYGIRGVGFYTQRLIKSLQNINQDNILFDSFNFKSCPYWKFKKYDLIHYPYFDPFFLTLPLKKIKPTIVTIHDLIPIKFSQHFPRGVRGEIKWQIQKFSLQSTKAIITDSVSSQKDIISLTGIKKEKVKVIYLAAGEEFVKLPAKKAIEITRKFNLPKKFILYVGDLNWNKNINSLIKAYSKISAENFCLVIVGKVFLNKNLAERIFLADLIKKLNISHKVKFLGFISTRELVGVYNLASCLVQPSYYEGFGLPVLEAMACGCPVIASNVSSLPEIAGKAALLVEPKVEKFSSAIEKLIKNENLRKKYIILGLKQAKKFSWDITAKKTLQVYKEVIFYEKQ